MSTIDRIATRHVDVERTTVISAPPFDTVVSKVAAAIGHRDMTAFGRAVADARPPASSRSTGTLDNWDPCEPEAVNGG